MVKEKSKQVKGYIAVGERDRATLIREEFKGEVFDKPINFPRGLGAEHPFNFVQTEKVYKRVGFVAGAVNKVTDSVTGDFSVEVKNQNAQAIINDFIDNSNFQTVIRTWIREGVVKGNGFMELDLNESRVRVLNANNIFVKRNKKGKVLEYNQFTGDLNKFTRDSNLLVSFKPNEIAHLQVNKIPNDPYGIGMVWPNERVIENIINMEEDLVKLISRKAGAPLHIKIGVPGEQVQQAAIDKAKSDVVFLNNKTEWVSDANVDIKVVEFKDLPKNLLEPLQHNFRMFLAGIEVPEVMMGSGQLNEGIAQVQLETFERRIKSIRQQVEDIIEKQIIRPLLRANDLDESPVFKWVIPGEDRIDQRIANINKLLNVNTNISPESRAAFELELSRLMDLEDLEEVLPTAKDAHIRAEEDRKNADRDRQNEERRREEEEIPQPEVPGAKPNANQGFSLKKEIPEGEITSEIPNAKKSKEGFKLSKKLEESKFVSEVPNTKKNKSGFKITKKEEKEEKTNPETNTKPNKEGFVLNTSEMSVKEFVNIKEIAGFNYTDYLAKIIQRVNTDKFEQLSAITESDFKDGLLSKSEIEKLRVILKDGFKDNKTIKQIEKDLTENLELRDRVKEGKIIALANNRSNTIVRTETVRIANEGLLDLYGENKIERVRWLAALSGRTDVFCESQNGRVFTIEESRGQIPAHVNCRCSWIPVVE